MFRGPPPRPFIPTVLDPNQIVGELAAKFVAGKQPTPMQAIRDLQLPTLLFELFEKTLSELRFALQARVKAPHRYAEGDIAHTMARRENRGLIFLHIPSWILDVPTDDNLAAMRFMMDADFEKTAPLFIMSQKNDEDGLDSPALTFNTMIGHWQQQRQVPARFVPWRFLIELRGLKQRQSDQLNALLGLDTIFPAAVGAPIAGTPLHGGDGGAKRLPKPMVTSVVDIMIKEAEVFPDGTATFLPYLISKTNLPQAWKDLLANFGRATPSVEVPRLVEWAVQHDVDPDDPGSTILGNFLKALLPILGGGNATFIKGLIKDYNL